MRALGGGADGDELGYNADPMATSTIFHKADDRASADYHVRVDPIKGTTRHFCDALGQIAGGNPHFAVLGIRRKPFAQMLRALRAKGDFGHVQGHKDYVRPARLTGKAAEDCEAKKDEKAHRIGNHRHKDGA